MEGIFILLILLAIGCIICGPIALIISIIALNKSKAPYREPSTRVEKLAKVEEAATPVVVSEKRVEIRQEEQPADAVEAAKVEEVKKVEQRLFKVAAEKIKKRQKEIPPWKTGTLEQRIGSAKSE